MGFRVSQRSKTSRLFSVASLHAVAFIDGQAVLERSHRLEFGIERVLDNSSNVEATAFLRYDERAAVWAFEWTGQRFLGRTGDAFLDVANQQGSSRGIASFTRDV
jgi:hypothetical protein